jgi:hypothetical protein
MHNAVSYEFVDIRAGRKGSSEDVIDSNCNVLAGMKC